MKRSPLISSDTQTGREPPTTRRDGSPLSDGDVWIDTLMKPYMRYAWREDQWIYEGRTGQ